MPDSITHQDKVAELQREVSLRRRVYPRWVAAGRLTQADADKRIAVLQAILDDYLVGTTLFG